MGLLGMASVGLWEPGRVSVGSWEPGRVSVNWCPVLSGGLLEITGDCEKPQYVVMIVGNQHRTLATGIDHWSLAETNGDFQRPLGKRGDWQ